MKAIWLSLAIFVVAPAQAGELCDKAVTTIEINQCSQAEHQAADRKLNVAYQAALKRIESELSDTQQGKDTKKGLMEAQRLWVRFRDKDCKAIYSLWSDGTIRGGMYWGCMIGHTEQRIRELESFTNQQ
jgi:uncharacterized protein YecT (DUF1311 family)